MRFVCFMEFENYTVMLPPWYRIGFASLLKEALKQGDNSHTLFNYYYGNSKKNIPKPFTFAVKLDVKQVEKGATHALQLGNKNVRLYVSSNNYEFIIAIYNGLRHIKSYPIYDNIAKVVNFNLLPEKKFNTNRAVYDIFSPVVVRRVDENKRGMGYASVNDSDYVQMLLYSIKSQCKFLGDSYCVDINSIKINTSQAFPVKIPHYNKENPHKPEVIVAADGCLEIEAPQEVLELIYNLGLGARRSQGFGMLEVEE